MSAVAEGDNHCLYRLAMLLFKARLLATSADWASAQCSPNTRAFPSGLLPAYLSSACAVLGASSVPGAALGTCSCSVSQGPCCPFSPTYPGSSGWDPILEHIELSLQFGVICTFNEVCVLLPPPGQVLKDKNVLKDRSQYAPLWSSASTDA